MRSSWKPPDTGAVLQLLLSPRDTLLFCHVFLMAAAVPWLCHLRLPWLACLLVPRRASRNLLPERAEKVIRFVEAVQAYGRPVVRRGCLTRGVTLFYFLRRAGLNVALLFGMGLVDGEFTGHCWLSREGEPFLEKADPRLLYAIMYSIPEHGAAGCD